jgi:hypothetical protein
MDMTAVETAIEASTTAAGGIGQMVLIAVATLVVVGLGIGMVKKL